MRPPVAALLALTLLAGAEEGRAQGVRTVVVTGQLVEKTGRPVWKGAVQLLVPGADSLNGKDQPELVLSDSLGVFVVRGPLKTGCYTLLARNIGYGFTVRTFKTITGSVNVGMMTMHSGPLPEMPTFYMLECEPAGTNIKPQGYGRDDTVRVEGTIDVPMQKTR